MSSSSNSAENGSDSRLVLAISQELAPMAVGEAPVTDYQYLAQEMDAIIVGNKGQASIRTVENRLALDFSQAFNILREHPDAHAYVSFSERIGIPLGLALQLKKRRPAHLMIAHRLDTRPKRLMDSIGRWRRGVDAMITLCTEQLRAAQRILPDSSAFLPAGSTDEAFYHPETREDRGYVLAVGSESRDYDTLISAAQMTGLSVKILSSSPWCRKGLKNSGGEKVEFLPRVSYGELRELYWGARLVALPLHDVTYAAGLNGLLEAFCAEKPVVVSDSRGINDYARHLHNAYVTPVGNIEEMAKGLSVVFNDAALRDQLVEGAKQTVEDYANLSSFTLRVKFQIMQAASRDRSL